MSSPALRCGGLLLGCSLALLACNAGSSEDTSAPDQGSNDARDAGARDGAERDGTPALDAEDPDAAALDSGDAAPSDMGAGDAGPLDASDGGADAALIDPCPSPGSLPCARAADCEADDPPPTNCGQCVPFNQALCVDTSCESPAVLSASDLYNVVINIDPNVHNLASFSAFAVASRTAGAIEIDCADMYAGRVDLSNRCYNVLLSRAYVLGSPGQNYSVGFVGFSSGQRTLFVIYGHTDTQARDPAVGISCSSYDIPPPSNGGPYFLAGDSMRAL